MPPSARTPSNLPKPVDAAALLFETPFQFRKRGVESKLVIGEGPVKQPDATLIRSIGKAHHYYDAIKRGSSFYEIAASEKLSKRRILQDIDLAFLAPIP
jgi:site-specific DNA recombinase